MKKILFVLLCGVVASFVACDEKKREPNDRFDSKDTTAIDSTLNDTTVVNPGDTTVVTPVEVTFEVSVTDVTSNGAFIEVAATPADAYFYFDVVDAAALDEMTKEEVAEYYLGALLEDYAEYADIFREEYGINSFEEAYLPQGTDEYDYTGYFDAETEYAVVAFSVNIADGNYTVGSVDASTTFTTLEATPVEPSNNTFTASIPEEVPGYFMITPSNEDTYFYTMYEKEMVDYLGAQYLLEYEISYYLQYGYLSDVLSSGVDGYPFCFYCETPGTYQLLVAGCSADGQLTTEVSVFDFEVTEELIAAGGCAEEGAAAPAKKQRFNGKISRDNGIKAIRVKDIARR